MGIEDKGFKNHYDYCVKESIETDVQKWMKMKNFNRGL